LASAAAFEAPRLGLLAGAVIVDHGLQEGSAKAAASAAATCEQLGLDPVKIHKVEVVLSGEGVEAAARNARYAALERARVHEGAELILLGHNLDDQAETVMLGLARGSGLASISGMNPVDPDRHLARPFLSLTRQSLRESCHDQGLVYWDDPHNQDTKYHRVRARNLLAQLETELGPGFASALARTAQQAADADEVITGLAAELLLEAKHQGDSKSVSYMISVLESSQRSVRTKAIFLVAQRTGARNISHSQIQQIDELITNWHGQKAASLSGITVERVKDLLVFKKSKPQSPGAC
jgi:tRNA(Ile)-lysidine synthase